MRMKVSEVFVYMYLHDHYVAAHITVQRQQGAIAIAISTPQSCPTTPRKIRQTIPKSSSTPPPMPLPFALSQPISSTSSWGNMMTPREVQELLAPQPQIGEYYVVTKGRRPGVYLSWWVFFFWVNVLFVYLIKFRSDAHELVDGLSSPCLWKKTDKYAAQGQYTVAYNKGSCEYRFQ